MTGMIGVAMSCEWGCSSEAPAASPWFLNTSAYSKRGSFRRSSRRSRNASRTSARASVDSVASVARWSGVSITTSWAPTPFIRSKSPSPEGSSSPSIRSAGNMLGTTRYDQPGWFGPLSGGRPARISGGVLPSLPGQKGQSPPVARTGSVAKSDGRRARSVEMMTQRPTIGSLRSSGIGLAVLAPERALEERGHRVHGRLAPEEHGADLLTDRHRHRVVLRERQRGGDGARALGDHARLPLDGGRRLPPRQRHAELAITREAAGARQDEVAEPGEPGERRRAGAEGHREARHLGEAARDEGGARVLAEREPVGQAGRDRHHVLERAAGLDADDVLARVEPELARAELPLERAGERLVPRGDDGGGRAAERHLPRKRRARERGDPRAGSPRLDDLAHPEVPHGVQAFRGRDDRHALGDRRQGLERRREELGRHRDDEKRRAVHRLGELRRRRDARGDVEVGEVPRAPASGPDPLDHLDLARPETHGAALPREVDRERRPPAPAADDREHHAALRPRPRRRSVPARRRPMLSWCRAMMIAAPAMAASIAGAP